MSIENPNLLFETLAETKFSQPMSQRTDRMEEPLLDTFSKKKKKGLLPLNLPLSHFKPPSIDDNDKLTLNGPFRKDAFGNTIKKRQKSHKLTIKDEFVEIVRVENWKRYNILEERAEEKTTCHCNCLIF